ncbi:MAG TPA: hypothetical protein VNO83_05295 [Pseudonocardia sp.]|nr:hypothetical protein [Pseudonocardia sp.]
MACTMRWVRPRLGSSLALPQVWGIARNMADAFGATLAAQMPQGGAQTGGGGMAGALVPPALPPVAGSGPVRPGPR